MHEDLDRVALECLVPFVQLALDLPSREHLPGTKSKGLQQCKLAWLEVYGHTRLGDAVRSRIQRNRPDARRVTARIRAPSSASATGLTR